MGDQVALIPPRLKSQPVTDPDQWEAFCSGPRLEIVLFLSAAGPCSVAELAHQMGAPPDGLYHHLRKVLKAGIVREVGTRRVGRQTEHLYDLVADHHAFDFDARTGRNMDRFRALIRTLHRRAERVSEAAFEAGVIDPAASPRPFSFWADATWLRDEDVGRVNALLTEIKQIFQAGRTAREGRLYSLTLMLSPLLRTRSPASRTTRRTAALDRETRRADRT